MLKHAGGTKGNFIEWAKLSPKFDANDMVIERFENEGKDYNGLAFLHKYAILTNPDYFVTENALLNDYYNPVFETVETITEMI